MPESPLAKKIKLKPGQRIAIVNAPDGYVDELRLLPTGVELAEKLQGKFDRIQIFVQCKAEMEAS